MTMSSYSSTFSYLCFLVYFLLTVMIILLIDNSASAQNSSAVSFNVGVVLDLNSSFGKTSMTSISMAVSDFYATHNSYKTRLVLHTRDSKNDSFGAASAALDLLNNFEVQAIVGPETSVQASFVVDMGDKAQVPIISFSARSPYGSSSRSPYFIRISGNDSAQVKAVTTLVQAFNWKEVIPISEDIDYEHGFVPSLVGSLQDIDIRVPYKSIISSLATDNETMEELDKLLKMQPRVFIVHMSPSLGSRFFSMAKAKGMMSQGYAWIITDSMTNHLNSMDSSVIESMQGVLGVRPYVPKSDELYNFRVKWKKEFLNETLKIERTESSTYALWAYDAVWALAMAVEEVGNIVSPFKKAKVQNTSSDLATLGVSQIGPQLLQSIEKIEFKGLSGEFHLINGQLQASIFQILNVNGIEGREIGFLTPKNGILRHLSRTNLSTVYNISASNLGGMIWPGESTVVPRGWAIPLNGRRLRIGVPVKSGLWAKFVEVRRGNKSTSFYGYSIDVFNAVMKALPYDVRYEYIPFKIPSDRIISKNYDDLIYEVFLQNFDAVVGDVSILPNRSLYVDFTLPYTETGLWMVVPIKEGENKSSWVFLRPLSMEMWLSTVAAFIFTGCVIWILEHRINTKFRGSPTQQLGMIFWFSFSTVVFAHRERVRSNLSRLVLIIWVFVVLILTSSYTASLTSTLTVQQLAVSDIDQLIKNRDYIGYQQGSYVKGVLKRLRLDESRLRGLGSPGDYADALSKGSRNGGVAAIFDEIPYIKLFLSHYCNKFAIAGPTVNTNGFGFVFRKGSPLIIDVSKAILKITDEGKINQIESAWLGDRMQCPNSGSSAFRNSLTIDRFRGLFYMTIVTSGFALIIFFGTFLHDHKHILTNSGPENMSIMRRIKNLGVKFLQAKECSSATSNKVKLEEERKEQAMGSSSTLSPGTMVINIYNEEDRTITSADEVDQSPSTASRNEIEPSPIR